MHAQAMRGDSRASSENSSELLGLIDILVIPNQIHDRWLGNNIYAHAVADYQRASFLTRSRSREGGWLALSRSQRRLPDVIDVTTF